MQQIRDQSGTGNNKDTQQQHNKLTESNALTFIHKEGQVNEKQVKLIRAGQIITVEGKGQRQEVQSRTKNTRKIIQK